MRFAPHSQNPLGSQNSTDSPSTHGRHTSATRSTGFLIVDTIGGTSSALAFLAGFITLSGWILSIEALKALPGSNITMKANASICMTIAGAVFTLYRYGLRPISEHYSPTPLSATIRSVIASGTLKNILLALTALQAIIAFGTIAEYVFNLNVGLDTLFFYEPPGEIATFLPGRMARNSAATFALLSLCEFYILRRQRASVLTDVTGVLVGAVGLLALISYTYGVQINYVFDIQRYTVMAVHTGVGFALLGFAALTIQPERRIAGLIANPTSGGMIARRLLPFAVLIPVGISAMQLVVRTNNLLDRQSTFALGAVLTISLLCAVILFSARYASRLDVERQRILQDLDQARQMAESANSAKDKFIATLSHELRTPLTPISNGVQLLREEKELDESERALIFEMVERNVRHEVRLINDLLDITRIARQKISLEIGRCDLRSILDEAVSVAISEYKATNESSDPTVERSYGTPEVIVMGDAYRLQQVFHNIVKNALKFSNGAPVRVTTELLDDRGRTPRVVVSVIDQGIGLKQDKLDHIFSPFEQAESSMTRKFGGLGLGLAIARSLTEMHGGTIQAFSDGPGKGARFVVELSAEAEVPELKPYS